MSCANGRQAICHKNQKKPTAELTNFINPAFMRIKLHAVQVQNIAGHLQSGGLSCHAPCCRMLAPHVRLARQHYSPPDKK